MRWVSVAFLRCYLQTEGIAQYASHDRGSLQVLLELFLLEKAVRELGYELDNRRDWLWIPLYDALGLLQLDD